MKTTPAKALKYSLVLMCALSVQILLSCAKEAPTIEFADITGTIPSGAPGDVTLSTVTVEPTGTNVPINSKAYIRFNTPVDTATITAANIPVTRNAVALVGYTLTASNPSDFVVIGFPPIANGDVISIQTTANLLALANGTALSNPNSYSFTFAAAPDLAAPTISSRTPIINAVDAATTAVIDVTFNENIDQSSVTGATFYIEDIADGFLGSIITGAYTFPAADTIRLTPLFLLADENVDGTMDYRVHVTSGVKDLAGNSFAGTTWDFDMEESDPYVGNPDIVIMYATDVTAASATIRWAYTEPASYILRWGTNDTYPNTVNGATVFASSHETALAVAAGTRYYVRLLNTEYEDFTGNTGLTTGAIQFNTPTADAPGTIQGGANDQHRVNLISEVYGGTGLFGFWTNSSGTDLIYGQYYNSLAAAQWAGPPGVFTASVSHTYMSAGEDNNAAAGISIVARNQSDSRIYAKRMIKGTGAIQGYPASAYGFPLDDAADTGYTYAYAVPVTKTLTHDRMLFVWRETSDNGIYARIFSADFHIAGAQFETGTSNADLLIDAGSNFTSVAIGDIIINTTTTRYMEVSAKYDTTTLQITEALMAPADAFSIYTRNLIDSGNTALTGAGQLLDSSGLKTWNTIVGAFPIVPATDVAQRNDTKSFRSISGIIDDNTLTVSVVPSDIFSAAGNPYNIFRLSALLVSGTHDGSTGSSWLVDTTKTFLTTGTVAAGDIAYNVSNNEYMRIIAVTGETRMQLSESLMGSGVNYRIYKKYEIDSGVTTGFGVPLLIDAGKDWQNTKTIQIGDIVFNQTTDDYAAVTAVAPTTLTISKNIFTAAGQTYRIYRPGVLHVDQFTVSAGGNNPNAISDGSGNAIVVYNDNGGQAIVVRINSDGVISWNTAVSTRTETLLKSVSDGAGGVVILFKAIDNLYAQRIDSTGTALWGAAGLDVEIAGTSTLEEDILYESGNGANGGVIVAARTTLNDLWVNRVSSGGGTTWAAAYNPVVPGTQRNPHVFISGADVRIAWEDNRFASSVGYGIFGVQLTLATGAGSGLLANSGGGTDDYNGRALILNAANKTWLNIGLVPYNVGANAFIGFEDYRLGTAKDLRFWTGL